MGHSHSNIHGIQLTYEWSVVAWATLEAIVFLYCSQKTAKSGTSTTLAAITKVSQGWVKLLLFASCLSLSIVPRLVAGICLGCFFLVDRNSLNKSQAGFLAIMANIQILLLAVAAGSGEGLIFTALRNSSQEAIPFLFLTTALSIAIFDRNTGKLDQALTQTWTALLRTALVILALLSLSAPAWPGTSVAIISIGFTIATITEILQAVRRQQETHVWIACAAGCTGLLFLEQEGLFSFGFGISQFMLLAISVLCLTLAHAALQRKNMLIIRRPLQLIGQSIPMLVTTLAIISEMFESRTPQYAMAMIFAAEIYFQQAMVNRRW